MDDKDIANIQDMLRQQKETIQILIEASQEIQNLRRQNQMMAAELRIIRIFEMALTARMPTQILSMSDDIEGKIQLEIVRMNKADIVNVREKDAAPENKKG